MNRAFLILLLSLAPAASAEVRLDRQPSGLRLLVRPVARGIWTPTPGASDREVLNPQGDALGHGYPGHAATREEALVAWHEPAAQGLRLILADHSGIHDMGLTPALGMVGIPQVLKLNHAWLVTWQASSAVGSEVRGVVIHGGTVADAGVLQSGTMLAMETDGQSIGLATFDLTSGNLTVTGFVSLVPNPVPIPIEWSRFRVAHPARSVAMAGVTTLPRVCSKQLDRGFVMAWMDDLGGSEAVVIEDGRLMQGVGRRAGGGSCSSLLALLE